VITIVLALAAARRAPVVTFGIVWCAIALFPVHNVLVPTGIFLAERTLFLPSVGVLVAVAGVATLVVERAPRSLLKAIAAATALLLVLGTVRSAFRHPVWHDQFKLWYVTANQDAPRSFRAHAAMAQSYFLVGAERMAEEEYRLAIQFSPPRLTGPRMQYADRLRSRGLCYPAVEQYRIIVELRPTHAAALAALTSCLLDLGYYREAMFRARLGISLGWRRPAFQQMLGTADSAFRVNAPHGTVRVELPATDSAGVYTRIGAKKG
jgi:tetratricopeptide (TPR) repeat protein